jgi:hypothetical protein
VNGEFLYGNQLASASRQVVLERRLVERFLYARRDLAGGVHEAYPIGRH